MAVKDRYKIPTSLDVSYFDMEFNLKSKNGVGINQPITAKVILFTLMALMLWFYIIFQTFIGSGGIVNIVLFTLSYAVLAIIMIKADRTRRTGLELILSAINYIPKKGRYLPVRMSDSVYPLQNLANLETIEPEDGRIIFKDKGIGHIYHVVGTASALMFDGDKQRIIEKVDSFYRKLPTDVEIMYDTVYEGHDVAEQIANVKSDRRNLNANSRGLNILLKEQHDILKYAINDQSGLVSLHQYLIVRAESEAALREFENLLIGDVENEGLMFRLAKTLNYEEAQRYYRSFLGFHNVD